MMRFPAKFKPSPEGGFVVTFPDIPEAVTQGDDEAEAMRAAEDALEAALSGRCSLTAGRMCRRTPHRRLPKSPSPRHRPKLIDGLRAGILG